MRKQLWDEGRDLSDGVDENTDEEKKVAKLPGSAGIHACLASREMKQACMPALPGRTSV
jgi:hypothetical protein